MKLNEIKIENSNLKKENELEEELDLVKVRLLEEV